MAEELKKVIMLKDILDPQRFSTIPHSMPHISSKDKAAVEAVLKSGMIAEGEVVEQFEQAVSKYLGMAGGVATSSGTTALFLALKCLDVGEGDEVVIPSYVCRSVWDAVSATGARPVLCDIGEDWCINIHTVEPHITRKTKAIILVHIFGIVADADPLLDLGIPIIEDCAQAFGARRGNKIAGTFGRISITSFQATKPFTTAEGGMALSNNENVLKKIRGLKKGVTDFLALRYLYPMTDLQAALGLSQLARYDEFLHRREEIANYYFSELKDLPLQLPRAIRDKSIFFRFPLRTKRDFEELKASFLLRGIHVRRGVDSLLHRQCGMKSDDFPGTERLFSETVCLPLYPALNNQHVKKIVTSCQEIFSP
jgi:UDP-4-amino-4-deoxy-L-arabinose-oxoglutarate aminotransferase